MRSALYRGYVVHHRRAPVEHVFRKRLYMLYLDLAELPQVFRDRWLWSVERRNVVSFRRSDHLGDPSEPLDESVRRLVARRTGRRPEGPIRLLTLPRCLGLAFNPVSFYYVFDAEDRLETVVAGVTNTPWNERHAYVLVRERGARGLAAACPKSFHVSPFMDLEQRYRFAFSAPGERLRLAISNEARGGSFFHARLDLAREPLGARSCARALASHPSMTGSVLASIYVEALRLWWKGAPYHPHPGRRLGAAEVRPS